MSNLRRLKILSGGKYPLNRFDELGKTPLHYAVQENHLEVVKWLLDAGARMRARS